MFGFLAGSALTAPSAGSSLWMRFLALSMFEVAGVAVDAVTGFAPAASASLFLCRVFSMVLARAAAMTASSLARAAAAADTGAVVVVVVVAGLAAVVTGFVLAAGFAAAVVTGLAVVAGLTAVAVAGFTAVAAAGLIGLTATDVDAGLATVVAGARTTGAGVGATRTTGAGVRTTGAGAVRTTGAGDDVVVVLFLVSARADDGKASADTMPTNINSLRNFMTPPKNVELNGRTNDRTGLFLRNSLKLPGEPRPKLERRAALFAKLHAKKVRADSTGLFVASQRGWHLAADIDAVSAVENRGDRSRAAQHRG